MKIFLFLLNIFLFFSLGGKTLEWKGNKLLQWRGADGLQVVENNGNLLLIQTKPGGSLEFSGGLNAADYDYLELKFKALELPARNNGKLLFAAPNKPFSSKQVVWFEHLKKSDGFITLRVPLNEAWKKCGRIGKLRLSIPNQAPAKVMLEAVRLTQIPRTVAENGVISWTGREGFAAWQAVDGAAAKIDENGILILTRNKPGGGLEFIGSKFKSAGYEYLEVEYRVKSIPERNNGKLLFTSPGKTFSAKQAIWFENLRCSPEFQILRVKLNGNKPLFASCDQVSRMRLCIPNQAPAQVEIRAIRLMPERKVVQSAARQYLFKLSETGKTAVAIPDGEYFVYLVNFCGGANRQLKFSVPLVPEKKEMVINGSYQYHLLGRCAGGKITISGKPDGNTNAVLFADRKAPGGFPERAFFPQTDGMVEAKPAKADLPVAYYSGYMVRAALDTPGYTGKGLNQFVFRKEFTIIENIKKAQVQFSGDDRFMLTLNGKKIAEKYSPDGWREPPLVDITALLKPGKNLLEGIYQNIGGPGGIFMELEYIDSEGKYHNFGSDKSFVFAGKKINNWQLDGEYTAFTAGVEQSAPPHPPWTTQLPFTRLTLTPAVKSINHRLVKENGKYFWEFDCGTAADTGTRVVVTLLDAASFSDDAEKLFEKTFTVSQVTRPAPGKFRFPVELPEYYPSAKLKLRCFSGNINWGQPEFTFDFTNERKRGRELDCRVVNGRVLLNGKPVYPVIGNSYHSFAEANYHLAGVNFRTAWSIFWVGVDQYDFTDIDAKVNEILALDENVKLWLFPSINAPETWGKAFPDERVCYFDGTHPHLKGGLASFASHRFREDAARALEKFIEHVQNSSYADKVIGYVVACGYTDEWQHWDSHRGNPKGAMLDYSPAAKREYARFIAENAPELSTELPTPAERVAAGQGMLLDPEKHKKIFLHSQFHSKIVADCIEFVIKRVRKAAGEGKLLGIYYGYLLEYANMGFKVHNSGHNALAQVLNIRELDALFSPPSYGVRTLGDGGGDMKPYGSIRLSGKLSIIDDDTRTHMIGRPVGFYQTVNPIHTRNIMRRNFGRDLCRMEAVSLFSLTTGNEFSSPETVADIRRFMKVADFALRENVKTNAEIAVVVSERGNSATRYCDIFDRIGSQQLYNGNGSVSFRPLSSQKLTAPLIYHQRNVISQLGAPADILLAESLADVEKLPYKLYIFLNLFAPDERISMVVKSLQDSGKKLLFCYAPGGLRGVETEFAGFRLKPLSPAVPVMTVSDREHPATAGLNVDLPVSSGVIPLFAVEESSGVRVLGRYPDGNAALAVRKNSVFCGVPALSPGLLRSLVQWAGVHIYAAGDDVLYANSAFVGFHAVTAGKKSICLPQKSDVVDAFTGEVIGRNCDRFSFDAALHDSRLFYCGDAGKFLKTFAEKNQ
ncbi:MAG: hypothetical protein E7057_05540 [Lentisphaerae bacterium]|nr:hypothetical protein [Lentisphaerota bacterium]